MELVNHNIIEGQITSANLVTDDTRNGFGSDVTLPQNRASLADPATVPYVAASSFRPNDLARRAQRA